MRRDAVLALAALILGGCMTPEDHRDEADDAAYAIIDKGRAALLGIDEPFTVETPADTLRRRLMLDQDLPFAAPSSLTSKDVEPIEQWPDDRYLEDRSGRSTPPWPTAGLQLDLMDSLRVGARNSREYQRQKELVFQAALALDLEDDRFRRTWTGLLSGGGIWDSSTDPPTNGVEGSGDLGLSKRYKNGTLVTVNIAKDIAKLTSDTRNSSLGKLFDMTVSVPLLRGSGEFIVAEPLKQAERNVVYAIYNFERFKRVFAVQIAAQYLLALREMQSMHVERENYQWLIVASRRALREAEAQRLPEIEVDQTLQDELQARDAWISAIKSYELQLDILKQLIGVPVDAELTLDMAELERLADGANLLWPVKPRPEAKKVPYDEPVELVGTPVEDRGPVEMDPREAIVLALQNRLDLRVAVGRVFDAQRKVAIGADSLRADLTLFGRATIGDRRTLGQANQPSADLHADDGVYSVVASLDLPFERTFERNIYRTSLINFEFFVRAVQELEDLIKLQVRDALRRLEESREIVQIQNQSLALAQRRVDSVTRFMRVDRASSRDLLEAQRDLVFSQNSFYSSLVRYRTVELELQRDLGLLMLDDQGVWTEFRPGEWNLPEGVDPSDLQADDDAQDAGADDDEPDDDNP